MYNIVVLSATQVWS